jgi:phosphocarrier protein HPr
MRESSDDGFPAEGVEMSKDGTSSDTRLEARIRIPNRMGLHARPAAEFVKLAGRFRAAVKVSRDDVEVDGKSIMGVLMLAAEQGCELVIRGEGDDAEAAIEALVSLVDRGFGED